MPEALAVVLVFVVSVIIYAGAWLRSRDPSLVNAQDELQRLRHHEACLRRRLDLAQREGWEREMIEALAAELSATSRQLAQAQVTVAAR